MIIKCKSSKRFLCEIDIENYYTKLKKMGIDITAPIKLTFACPKCHLIEVYDVYPTHYVRSEVRESKNVDK